MRLPGGKMSLSGDAIEKLMNITKIGPMAVGGDVKEFCLWLGIVQEYLNSQMSELPF